MLLEVLRRRGAPVSEAASASEAALPAGGVPGPGARASSGDGVARGAEGLDSKASTMRITDHPQAEAVAAQDPPGAHPAALQPALSARRSFGQGLWWPGAAGAGETDPGEASATGPAARLSRSSSVADGGSSSTDAETGSDTGSRDDSGSDSDSGSRSSGSEHNEAAFGATAHGGEGEAWSAVALELVDLSVDNIDVIEPHNLTLQVGLKLDVACERPAFVVSTQGAGLLHVHWFAGQ